MIHGNEAFVIDTAVQEAVAIVYICVTEAMEARIARPIASVTLHHGIVSDVTNL
jgi:hypothetical protein